MKILLCIPTHHYPSHPTFLSFSDFPQGMAYLAGALKSAGHDVIGCNPNNLPNYPTVRDMLTDVLRKRLTPDIGLIGLGGLCTDYTFLRDVIRILWKLAPTTPIVLGGNIITNDAEFIFNHLKPDFAIVGEGEETIVQLANMIQSGRKNYHDIDNLCYWREE